VVELLVVQGMWPCTTSEALIVAVLRLTTKSRCLSCDTRYCDHAMLDEPRKYLLLRTPRKYSLKTNVTRIALGRSYRNSLVPYKEAILVLL